MRSALEDRRRFRRHTLVLPPEARALAPLDVVEWTSARNGYADKLFQIDMVEDLANGCVAVSLREVDPADYDFDSADLLPTSVGFSGRPPRLPWPKSFSVSGVSLPDADGEARVPAIKLDWNPDVRATGVRWKYRLAGQDETVPQLGGADYGDEDAELYGIEVFAGQPLEVTAGEALVSGWFSDVTAGTTVITPVLPLTAYEVKARYAPDGDWSAWLPVITPPTYLKAVDLDAALNDRVDQAQANADAAAADAAAALAAAAQAAADVATLAGDTVDDSNALIAALGGIDAGDVLANRALALAALQTGWNADPTFQSFTGDLPDRWTHAGLTGHASPFPGYYGGGLSIDTPGSTTVTLRAASDVAGQMPAADPSVEWVVVYAMLTVTAGDPDAIRIRAAWKAHGSSTWTAGHMRGITNALGTLTQHGLAVKPGVTQGFEVLVQRPVGADAEAVSVFLGIDAAFATPLDLDVHLLGIRAATEAEIAANAAPGALEAAVTTLSTEITGISDALAALQTSLTATAPAGTLAHLAATYLTAASTTSAIAAATTSLQAQIDGAAANLALHYYTRAELEDELPTLVGGISAELSGRLDTAEAAIADQAAFRVTADNQLAGRVSTIEARRDPGSVVTNGSFVRETRASFGADGTPVATVVDFAGWANVAATFTTVAKSGTTAPLSTCPTPWCCAIAYSSAARTAENETLRGQGRRPRHRRLPVCGRRRAAAPRSGSSSAGSMPAACRSAPRSAMARRPRPRPSGRAGRSNHIGPAPANTAYVRIDLQRNGGGAGTAYVTGVEARKADTRALARIAATEAVATSASGAISTLTGLITAEFGTQSAFVSDTKSAVATVDRLAATWVFRQKAGAAVGTAEAVAFESPDGTAISTFRLDYDLIDLDGRVTARDLNVSSSVNMVPDDQLQDPVGWGLSPGDPNWTHYPVSSRSRALARRAALGRRRGHLRGAREPRADPGEPRQRHRRRRGGEAVGLLPRPRRRRRLPGLPDPEVLRQGRGADRQPVGPGRDRQRRGDQGAQRGHRDPRQRRLLRPALGGEDRRDRQRLRPVLGAGDPPAEQERRDRRRRGDRREGELRRPRRGGGDAWHLYHHQRAQLRRRRRGHRRHRAERGNRRRRGDPREQPRRSPPSTPGKMSAPSPSRWWPGRQSCSPPRRSSTAATSGIPPPASPSPGRRSSGCSAAARSSTTASATSMPTPPRAQATAPTPCRCGSESRRTAPTPPMSSTRARRPMPRSRPPTPSPPRRRRLRIGYAHLVVQSFKR